MCLTIDLKWTTALIRLHKSAPREVHQREGCAGIWLSLNTLWSGAAAWAVCVCVCVCGIVGLAEERKELVKVYGKRCIARQRQLDGTMSRDWPEIWMKEKDWRLKIEQKQRHSHTWAYPSLRCVSSCVSPHMPICICMWKDFTLWVHI